MGSDFQRTIMWVILAVSCFMLWDNWQVYNGKESVFGPVHTEQTEQVASTDVANQATAKDLTQNPSVSTAQPVEVSTNLLKITFDQVGAVVNRAELLQETQQPDWRDVGLVGLVLGREAPALKNIVLFDVSAQRTYVAQSGLVGGNFPTHKSQFTHVGTNKSVQMDNEQGREVNVYDVIFESTVDNVKVRKIYQLVDGRYSIRVRHEITNNTGASIQPSVYYQLMRDGSKPETDSSFTYTYTGPAIYTSESKFQKIPFDDIGGQPDHQTKANNGWVAMIQHYFISAWTDVRGVTPNYDREFYTRKLDNNLYSVGTIHRVGQVQPQATLTSEALLYVGPQDQRRLSYLADDLDLVVDYGWLTFLAKPIYLVLQFLYSVVGNWGWAIVLLTVLVKALLYPISAAGYKSMARMKEVTPRMKALQEQYKDDKQRYQQALMDLYRKEKINPVGGCLPILLQIPVFLALYWVLLASVELRNADWIFWIHDLASPDPWYLLPAVMMVSMFVQIKLNPTPADPMQARMMMIMPLVFGVMFFFFASGLVLYWFTNNVLSIAQQWYVNRQIAQDRARRMAEHR